MLAIRSPFPLRKRAGSRRSQKFSNSSPKPQFVGPTLNRPGFPMLRKSRPITDSVTEIDRDGAKSGAYIDAAASTQAKCDCDSGYLVASKFEREQAYGRLCGSLSIGGQDVGTILISEPRTSACVRPRFPTRPRRCHHRGGCHSAQPVGIAGGGVYRTRNDCAACDPLFGRGPFLPRFLYGAFYQLS